MNQEYINQNDIAHRYIHNKLTPEEASEFEVYLMDNHDAVVNLQLDMLFKKHLKKQRKGFFSRLHLNNLAGFTQPAFTFCFGVLFASIIGYFTYNSSGSTGHIELVYLSDLRGAADTPDSTYSLSQGAGQLLLVLQPSITTSEPFDVLIKYAQQQQIIMNTQVNPNSVGDIVVALPTKSLTPGVIDIEYGPKHDVTQRHNLKVLIEI